MLIRYFAERISVYEDEPIAAAAINGRASRSRRDTRHGNIFMMGRRRFR